MMSFTKGLIFGKKTTGVNWTSQKPLSKCREGRVKVKLDVDIVNLRQKMVASILINLLISPIFIEKEL